MLPLLVVDSDRAVKEIFCSLIEEAGYPAVGASDAHEALGLLSRSTRQFGALVTDFRMPCMNGLQLAQAAREIDPGLPVLIISGDLTDPAPALPAAEYLAKPVHLSALCEAIKRLLAPAS